MEPQRIAQPERIERRSGFVRYYSPSYFSSAPAPERVVVFRRYVPQRYMYSQYAPIYGSAPVTVPVYYNRPIQVPLPIAWNPVTYYGDNDGDEYGYGYNGYENPYYGYGYNNGYGNPYYNNYNNPYYGSPCYGQYNGYQQCPYAAAQYPFATQQPYGNPYQYGFGPFGMNGFGNAQLQGIVISNTNGGLLVLTQNLQPVFVNTSIAQQNGYINGNITPGSFVYVFGYNTGNEFIATALG